MRPDGSDIIPGFLTQLTLTGGFANKTLFEQAGVRDARGQGRDLVRLGGRLPRRSRKSQQLPFAFAIDRSGHRISGPIASYGGNYIGPDRKPAPLDEGAKAFIKDFVDWNKRRRA